MALKKRIIDEEIDINQELFEKYFKIQRPSDMFKCLYQKNVYYYYYCYDYDYYKMETFFMDTENSKTNESHRFRLDLSDKLNLKNPKKKYGFS